MIAIGNQPRQQIHQEVKTTAVTRMLNLTNVFELVIDRFNDGSFTQQNLIHKLDKAILHILAPSSNHLQALGIKLLKQRL